MQRNRIMNGDKSKRPAIRGVTHHPGATRTPPPYTGGVMNHPSATRTPPPYTGGVMNHPSATRTPPPYTGGVMHQDGVSMRHFADMRDHPSGPAQGYLNEIGGARMISGKNGPTTLFACPCGETCNGGGACTCAKCAETQKVWTQSIIPIAANIRTTTRQGADMIRGDINILSAQAPLGWFHTSGANRIIEKGARHAVFGVC